jgi:hypothetical protein
MKSLFYILAAVIFVPAITSCLDIVEDDTPENVFEVFWRTMDENYVYFEEKGVNWDSVYTLYAPRAKMAKGDDDLCAVFQEIIPLFNDGHLSLYKKDIYIHNASSTPFRYGIKDYGFTSKELEYAPITDMYCEDTLKHIGYVRIGTFSYYSYPSYDLIDYDPEKALKSLDCSNGLIIDLRDNTGGAMLNLFNFISAFYTGKKVLYSYQDKSGKGHSDFGEKIPVTKQGKGYIAQDLPLLILTSNATYSAANIAIYMLKELRHCTITGEATGGGGGTIKEVLLPASWVLSFPYSKDFSASGKNMEYPYNPDIFVKQFYYEDIEYENGKAIIPKDTTLMTALDFLDNLQIMKK